MLLIVAAGAGGAALLAHRGATSRAEANPEALTVGFGGLGTAPSPLAVRLDDPARSAPRPLRPPAARGLLFNVDTGEVLYRRRTDASVPIASLTKMMTALLVVDNVPPGRGSGSRRRPSHFQGSGVGLLPRGRRIGVETMLHGLLLPSGNDAAIALAQRVGGGTLRGFVRADERAARRRWACVHALHVARAASWTAATTRARPTSRRSRARCCASRGSADRARAHGDAALPDQGRASCTCTTTTRCCAALPRRTGLKTGYTDAAGRCLVATARRGTVHLGVVLLHSPDRAARRSGCWTSGSPPSSPTPARARSP